MGQRHAQALEGLAIPLVAVADPVAAAFKPGLAQSHRPPGPASQNYWHLKFQSFW